MKTKQLRNLFILTGLLALAANPASAHLIHENPTTVANGFTAGLAHPFSGLDHLLAMIAVGMWGAQGGGRRIWALPVAFVSVMLLGGLTGMMGWSIPLVEPGIAASVLVLGLMVAFAVRMPMVASMGLVGLFAFFHGHAHGTELPAAAAGEMFTMGFTISTIALHAIGITIGLSLPKLASSPKAKERILRAGGGLVTAAGALMIAGVL